MVGCYPGVEYELRSTKNNSRCQCNIQLLAIYPARGMDDARLPYTQRRWVKILPHVIDTVLLASAIVLVTMIQQYSGMNTWLSAKIGGILLYIILGMMALRFGKTRKIKTIAWITAQIVFFYIVLVALTKNPSVLY